MVLKTWVPVIAIISFGSGCVRRNARYQDGLVRSEQHTGRIVTLRHFANQKPKYRIYLSEHGGARVDWFSDSRCPGAAKPAISLTVIIPSVPAEVTRAASALPSVLRSLGAFRRTRVHGTGWHVGLSGDGCNEEAFIVGDLDHDDLAAGVVREIQMIAHFELAEAIREAQDGELRAEMGKKQDAAEAYRRAVLWGRNWISEAIARRNIGVRFELSSLRRVLENPDTKGDSLATWREGWDAFAELILVFTRQGRRVTVSFRDIEILQLPSKVDDQALKTLLSASVR